MVESAALLVRDAGSSHLELGPEEPGALERLLGHPITYRIAVGPNEGRKAFTLQTLTAALTPQAGPERLAKNSCFSLHAGVAAAAIPENEARKTTTSDQAVTGNIKLLFAEIVFPFAEGDGAVNATGMQALPRRLVKFRREPQCAQHRPLLGLVRIHAPQDVVEDADGLLDVRSLV
jgi:hypothetical protein